MRVQLLDSLLFLCYLNITHLVLGGAKRANDN